MGLTFPSGPKSRVESLQLEAWSDSDFAQDQETRKSVSGQIIKVNGGVIAWRSSLQKSVSLSTCESKLVTICEAVKTSQWIANILEELQITVTVSVLADTTAAIRLVKGPELHARSKHTCIFFIRECYEAGRFQIDYVPRGEQIPDICTKPLPKATF